MGARYSALTNAREIILKHGFCARDLSGRCSSWRSCGDSLGAGNWEFAEVLGITSQHKAAHHYSCSRNDVWAGPGSISAEGCVE